MPSDTMPAADDQAPDADAGATASGNRLPVLAVVLAAYRFIGEHLGAFIGVATLVGVGNYLLLSQSPLSSGSADFSPRDFARHWIVLLGALGFASAVYAVAGVRWCRAFIMGERPRYFAPPGGREVRFALCVTLLVMVLALFETIRLLFASNVPFAVTDWVEQRFFLPPDTLWTGTVLILQVAAKALLCLTLPGIAMDAVRPLGRAMGMARSDFRALFAVYLLGLIPWAVVQILSFKLLVLRIDIERLQVAVSIMDAWIMTCTIALAAAAYRALTDRHAQQRIAAVFE